MTPKEKAQQLCDLFFKDRLFNKYASNEEELSYAKFCALICVEEILTNALDKTSFYDYEQRDYYTEVKAELEKL